MTPTRIRALLAVTVVCAAVTWLLLRLLYRTLPPLPWTGVPALVVPAVAEAWTGRGLRARILGRAGTRPVAPIAVARMVVLAKASAQTAAVIGGLAAGFAIYLAGSQSAAIPRSDTIVATATFAAAVVLAAAGLYLEYCCRIPKGPGSESGHHGEARSGY